MATNSGELASFFVSWLCYRLSLLTAGLVLCLLFAVLSRGVVELSFVGVRHFSCLFVFCFCLLLACLHFVTRINIGSWYYFFFMDVRWIQV